MNRVFFGKLKKITIRLSVVLLFFIISFSSLPSDLFKKVGLLQIAKKIEIYKANAVVSYFDTTSNPNDKGSLQTSPVSVAPPAGMQTGDLVIMVASERAINATLSISNNGGQSWTSEVAATNTSITSRIFWATYNGVWGADPSVIFSSTNSTSVVMHVYRPTSTTNIWEVDTALTNNTFVNANDITIPGINTNSDGAFVFANWSTSKDTQWKNITWTYSGKSQYRNKGGGKSSQSNGYKIMPIAGASGDVINTIKKKGTDGVYSVIAFKELFPPTLSISEPNGVGDTVAEDSLYNITYSLDDVDSVVTAQFYYDTNADMVGGVPITGACATAVEGVGVTCPWDTTGITPGSYYVYGTTSDGVFPVVMSLSPGVITINAKPTLSVSEPDGVSDFIVIGDIYDITYSLADADSVVTSAFYYDTDNIGLNGTAIAGACATAIEGVGATCSWDTSGMTAGVYYVYGITDDTINTQVSAYSVGQITINDAGVNVSGYINDTETNLNYSNCVTTGCGARITTGADQLVTISGLGFGAVLAGSRASCAGGAGTGCLRIANYTIPDANIIAWIDSSIQFRIPSGVTVFGGAGNTCGGVDGNGLCVTAAGADNNGGAFEFWVFPDIVSTTPSLITGAREGDTITIDGNMFGSTAGTLEFVNCTGAITATVGTWSDTQLLNVTVPASIDDSDDSCDLQVTRAAATGFKTDNAVGFVVLPTITSIVNHANVVAGNYAREFYDTSDGEGIIKIIGNHFGVTGVVQILGVNVLNAGEDNTTNSGDPTICSGGAYTSTCVRVRVPSSIGDSLYTGNLKITRDSDTKGDIWTTSAFRILPRIISFSPAIPIVAETLEIIGNHLCQDGSLSCPTSFDINNKITFTLNKDATVFNSWANGNSTSVGINIVVPGGATAGGVVIVSGGYSSNILTANTSTNTPSDPSSLTQYETDCSTVINDEAITSSGTVCLESVVAGGSAGGILYLQVEIQESAVAFSDATSESTTVSAPAGGTLTVNVPLSDTTNKWRARTCHNKNGTHNLACAGTGDYASNWVEYETGSVPTDDFTIDSTSPIISGISASPSEFNAVIDWNTNELATSNVDYDSSGSPYTFSVSPVDTVADSTVHSVSIVSNLSCGTTYYYVVKSQDVILNTESVSTQQSFNTTACNPRVMKTLEFQWVEELNPITSTNQQDILSLVANIEESTDIDFTIRSAALEMSGVLIGDGAGTPTLNLWINSTTPLTAIDFPDTTIPQNFIARYIILDPTADLNIASSSSALTNNVHYQFAGGFDKASLINVKLVVTYDYAP